MTSTNASVDSASPQAESPTPQKYHQKGGWIRSTPWSATLPHLDEVMVQRASFPSTVSSTMKTKPASMPVQYSTCATNQVAATQSVTPKAVPLMGLMPMAAALRISQSASPGP